MRRFYLDHNATTPLDPRVRDVMEPYLSGGGNPSSIHQEGRRARAAIDEARDRLATLLGAKPAEIIFTAGGTESNNLAVRGLAGARAWAGAGRHLITCATEHHAVGETCEFLEKRDGFSVTCLAVEADGRLDLAQLEKAFRSDTALVTIMSANNETGVRQPILEIARLCAEHRIPLHTDAVQSAGKEPLDLRAVPLTALSLTAHKFYGPCGAGLLFLRAGEALEKILHGGSQENTRRAGTENVAAIVGLAEAFALAETERAVESARQFRLVEELWQGLADLPGVQRNGHPTERIANTLNLSFANLDGEELLMGLDLAGLAVSSGSACLVGSVQPSHVLRAMGVPLDLARATVRFSLGRTTLSADIPEIITRVRQLVMFQHDLHPSGTH